MEEQVVKEEEEEAVVDEEEGEEQEKGEESESWEAYDPLSWELAGPDWEDDSFLYSSSDKD